MKQRVKINKTKVLQAIPGSRGIIALIAKRINASWTGTKEFIKNNPDVMEVYNDELNKTIDFVEDRMFNLIEDGNEGLIKYYLSKKAKDRGYGDDKKELDITTNGQAINIIKLVEVVKDGTDN
ncbi:MAG: hypothetical protein QXF70_03470 [Candidatus Bilamarchaeaceae archaeon]